MPRRTRALPILLALLALAGCESEEPAIQDNAIDDGGVYEDGVLEDVQPVEPEIGADSIETPLAPEP